MGWWRRLVEMPDRRRARLLANIMLGLLLVLLYGLGGVSVYLRSRYLVAATSTPVATSTEPLEEHVVSAEETPLPTPTLFPTLTPQGHGADGSAVLWPTITPHP